MAALCDFFFEAGQLKLVKRSGWWVAGVKDPESVAEHSYRTGVIAFVLAEMEGLDCNKICAAALFHDLHEARLQDRHKISQNYLDTPAALEKKITREQAAALPKKVGRRVLALNELAAAERAVLRDADLLECAVQAKEYFDLGYKDAWDWIIRIEKRLKTGSAKKIIGQVKRTPSGNWWRGLKKDIMRS